MSPLPVTVGPGVTDQGIVHTSYDGDGKFMFFYKLDLLDNMIIVDADEASTIA